jgi:pyruvate dehydrogenase E2 component (dihydrolipoamide acetyltransferase)
VTERTEPPQDAERAKGNVEVVELSAAQQSFARRVAESKATAPHVYFDRPVEAPAGLAALIAASAGALRELPLLNGAYRDGRVELYSRVNVAFGVEASGTLMLPVVHDADAKDRHAIADEIEELGERARDGTLTSPALAGATFTVIDMGASGAATFTPVITRGQAATLGAGSARLTLACDNRIVQGAEGAEFLGRVLTQL